MLPFLHAAPDWHAVAFGGHIPAGAAAKPSGIDPAVRPQGAPPSALGRLGILLLWHVAARGV